MVECINELELISPAGMKSKNDDFNDTISMLANLQTFKPSESIEIAQKEKEIWEIEEEATTPSRINSYIV